MIIKTYGPYLRKKDNRKYISIVRDGKRTSMSYPKWLMEQHLGRKLLDDETVDHINRDKTDDRIENLQILDRINHSKLDSKRVYDVKITCSWCGKTVLKKARELAHSKKQKKAGPFCSRSCAGKYGASVQNGGSRIDRYSFTDKRDYYFLDKLAPISELAAGE